MKQIECHICKIKYPENELITGHGIHHEIEKLIINDYPEWNDTKQLCKSDYNIYRMKYITSMIEEEAGSLHSLEQAIIQSIQENDLVASNINNSVQEVMSIGDRISDKVAVFGGSWKFIILFFVVLFSWILVNSFILR